MLVVDLEHMEKIVMSRDDLEWDGWDVVKYTKNLNAHMSPDGVYKNGQWFKRKVFPVTNSGWSIPNSIGLADAKMER
jgi:hypothetical protein